MAMEHFQQKLLKILKKKSGCENERFLIHGSKYTHPEQIYTDEMGIDIRHANSYGVWGRAIYFAEDALSSTSYCYTNIN
jgi:hypothetical protein